MFEIREPIHEKSRFLRAAVAIASASHPWKPTAGVQPANAPIATAQPISRGEARSDFARVQIALALSHHRRSHTARLRRPAALLAASP